MNNSTGQPAVEAHVVTKADDTTWCDHPTGECLYSAELASLRARIAELEARAAQPALTLADWPMPPRPEPSDLDYARWGYTADDMDGYCADGFAAGVAAARAQAAQPAQVAAPLQGGLSNVELALAWSRKLPGVQASDSEMSAFAVGVEVGFAHARDLERQDWSRVHHVLAKHGKHPGRTDDHLADVIDRALAQVAAPDREADETIITGKGLYWDLCLLAQTLEFSNDVRLVIQTAANEIERLQAQLAAPTWRAMIEALKDPE